MSFTKFTCFVCGIIIIVVLAYLLKIKKSNHDLAQGMLTDALKYLENIPGYFINHGPTRQEASQIIVAIQQDGKHMEIIEKINLKWQQLLQGLSNGGGVPK